MRKSGQHRFLIAVVGASLALAGCKSADQKAAADAATARALFEAGQPAVAQGYIRKAIAQRDDVSENWLLAAQIAIALQDAGGAFEAYENVAQLDQGNAEALNRLCQLALAFNDPERAEKYADRLALVSPEDPLAMTVRAAIAQKRGDRAGAAAILDKVLKDRPDDMGALMQRARMLADDQDYAAAAKVIEQTLPLPGDPVGRLRMLVDFRARAMDRPLYVDALHRLAQASPDDVDTQLAYADVLLDQGDAAAADQVLSALCARLPDRIALIEPIVTLWSKQRPAPFAPETIPARANAAPGMLKLAYALYANEIRRPDATLAILGPGRSALGQAPADLVARAALAYADGLKGDRGPAIAALDRVLQSDAQQPDALLARGRLKVLGGDLAGGREDLQRAVAQARDNAGARIALADLLVRTGNQTLAETTLRDGLEGSDDDPRVALRLATLLRASGRTAAADGVLKDLVRANPNSLQARRLAQPAG